MTEMVDRVAKAILTGYDWEAINPSLQAEYRRMARAAVAALGELQQAVLDLERAHLLVFAVVNDRFHQTVPLRFRNPGRLHARLAVIANQHSAEQY